MNAPKILPWIARKAGIEDELALSLWRRAASESASLYGNADSADYYAEAMSRFIDLVEEESGEPYPDRVSGNDAGWMWRQQKRIAAMNWQALQNLCRLWQPKQMLSGLKLAA